MYLYTLYTVSMLVLFVLFPNNTLFYLWIAFNLLLLVAVTVHYARHMAEME